MRFFLAVACDSSTENNKKKENFVNITINNQTSFDISSVFINETNQNITANILPLSNQSFKYVVENCDNNIYNLKVVLNNNKELLNNNLTINCSESFEWIVK